ncbi:MAG TPA: hypothetical protein PLJ47_12895 [Candidatus Hydrogenedentes bacterium]|nr:hypothetical protein [Candidatus Hydrogenedentota bacterium]
MKSKNSLTSMLKMAGDFVTQQKGKWEHKDWEAFLEQVQKAGIELTDEVKKTLGHLLEVSKAFYMNVSSVPNKKKPAKKSTAKAKSKAKTKAKAKSKSKA